MAFFARRIFTAGSFIEDMAYLAGHSLEILGALRNKRISGTFREKIMLVVTAVNGCAYCSWFHAKLAAASGLSRAEVKSMLDLQFQAHAAVSELAGLLYAQHYAETDRKPDREMTAKLFAHYGDQTARHIVLIVRMISFANLAGNTSDAFLSRLAGIPPANSNVLFEFLFFLATAPFLLPAKLLFKLWPLRKP